PPVHGVTVAIERVLRAGGLDAFELVHLDTSDPREATTVGRHDFRNYWLALKSYVALFKLLRAHRPAVVYVPISQSFVGYARDALYFVVTRVASSAVIVIHLHGGHFLDLYEQSGGAARALIDLTMRLPVRAIVLSDVFRGIFSRWFPDSSIDVVPNGA